MVYAAIVCVYILSKYSLCFILAHFTYITGLPTSPYVLCTGNFELIHKSNVFTRKIFVAVKFSYHFTQLLSQNCENYLCLDCV